jgi:hypothetical protein
MARTSSSIEFCRDMSRTIAQAGLLWTQPADRYEDGDRLDLDFTTVWPEVEGTGRFLIEKFVGGGFAGQVYRCVLEDVSLPAGAGDFGLRPGRVYAVKIMVPPERSSRRFRDLLYWIGFQAPFSAQVHRAACRSGLLWQRLARLAASLAGEAEDAVAEVHASFYDPSLRAFGEIREWVEGRTWRLEPDTTPGLRRRWQTVAPESTGSPEYVAKRQFMWRFVRLLHEMGAPELARQYEWWTMKSQPNTLKRAGADRNPAAGLCAVDFRAGLVLLPFLPMSPGDLKLIVDGVRRRSLAQFDRADFVRLRAFGNRFGDRAAHLAPMVDALERYDQAYRRSMPDLTHQGLRLLRDPGLRRDVRHGLVAGYESDRLADAAHAGTLRERPGAFALFYVAGAVPLLGGILRRLWGNARYREHAGRMWTDRAYLLRTFRAALARRLVRWHRGGRISSERARRLLDRPWQFWLERGTIGFLPAALHRACAEPAYVWERLTAGWTFVRRFFRDAAFREQWFTDLVEDGYRDGMLDASEREAILAKVRDPFIVKYLKCLGVHFACMPVTHVVAAICGGVVLLWDLRSGLGWASAMGRFALIQAAFQVTPISPGSICRGAYVLYLMIRERNFHSYVIAAPVSFAKYLGYLAFPFQMATTYPALARFMASRWATNAVHVVPVFGEKGALFEHLVFDACFNWPRAFGLWAARRVEVLLNAWLAAGVLLLAGVLVGCDVRVASKTGVNLLILVTAVFLLPRLLFYPMLRRPSRRRGPSNFRRPRE